MLGDVDADDLLAQVLQAMPVRHRADEARGDLGAPDRRGRHAEMIEQRGHIETREMEDLQDRGIGEKRFQIRRVGVAPRNLHQMADPVAARHLDEAQAVAVRVEAHRLSVDRDRAREGHVAGQVADMEMDVLAGIGHGLVKLSRGPSSDPSTGSG